MAQPLTSSLTDDITSLLFDLDGTLVDSTWFHTVSWFLAFDDAGERRPMWSIHPLIGMGGDELISELGSDPSDELSLGHDRHFARFLPSVRAFPGRGTY